MALGAERSSVVAMVMRSALLQTLVGLTIGVPVAYYGVTLVKSQLYALTTVSSEALVAAGRDAAAGGLRGWVDSCAAGGFGSIPRGRCRTSRRLQSHVA